jgi:hypothetical protein
MRHCGVVSGLQGEGASQAHEEEQRVEVGIR